MTRSSRTFDLRLVAYTPLGARGAVIPDLGLTVVNTPAGPTLTATVSSKIYGTLPASLEVAVEWWHASTKTWQEGRDSRFVITQQTTDDRDPAGQVTLQGVGLGAYMLAGTALHGVAPYSNISGTTEGQVYTTTASVSGKIVTFPGHTMVEGDRVRIIDKGKAKQINTGGVYFVRAIDADHFQMSTSATSATFKSMGTATGLKITRVCTRILFNLGHSFNRSEAIQTVGGAAVGLNDGTTYYCVNPMGTSIQISDKPNGTPIELAHYSTNISQVYRYLDGQRIFKNATPGVVMDGVFLEARDRGWGQMPVGTDQMFHGWTTNAGSDGVTWTKMADDPTTPGISIGYQPGTPGTQVLQSLLDNQYAEWYCTGRTINLVNYGTGNDHSADATPMRIGTTAASVKVDTDITNLRNAIYVRGAGPVMIDPAKAQANPSGFGRLETYESAQGATSKALATKQASTDLAANQNPVASYTVTEMAEVAQYIPLVSYSRGDWVAVQLKTNGWTRLRCVGWTLQKTSAGVVTVTTNLENIKRTLLTKQQKAIVTTSAGLTSTSTPGAMVNEKDNRKPVGPSGLAAVSTGFFGNDGSAVSTTTVSWLPVVTDLSGADVQVIEYDVWVRPDGALNGQSVGRTSGLQIDVTPLPSNATFAVSVRALTTEGQWGDFSPELDFTTAYPVTIPSQPTAPTVTGKLGQARISWDGNLLDPADGITPITPEAGFGYVQVWYSTTQAGTYTQIGSNMGNAGSVSLSGLAIGSTYWFALVAFNSIGVQSTQSAAVSYTIVGVTGPDLVANSVTANEIAAGAITSEELSVGAVPATASPVERVPQSAPTASYWASVISGKVPLYDGVLGSVQATTSGLLFTSTTTAPAQLGVTALNPMPPSGAIYISLMTSILAAGGANPVFAQVVERTNAGSVLGTYNIAASVNGTRYQFVNNAAGNTYSVKLTTTGGIATTDTVQSVHVFEVISTQGSGQGVELSPAGLQFFDVSGKVAMDLTTNNAQRISIYDNTGFDPVSVATIERDGSAIFTKVSTKSDFDDGNNLLFGPSANNLPNAVPNGGLAPWQIAQTDGTPGIGLLDIPGRSVTYYATWNSQEGAGSHTTQYYYIASDVFQVEDGRMVMVNLNNGGMAINANATTKNVYARLQLGLAPFAAAPVPGATVMSSVIPASGGGTFPTMPTVWSTSAVNTTIDYVNYVLPANVPIYWQYYIDISSTFTTAYQLDEFGQQRGLMVIDLGSNQVIGGAPINATDGRSSGSSKTTTTSTPTVTSKTITFTAKSSRTWNNNGNSIVSGTGQYTNGDAMYYGHGASAMGSWMGNFQDSNGKTLASWIGSGKTVTSATLTIQNTYCYGSSATVNMGTGSSATAPSTIGTPSSNTFSASFSEGQKKAITLGSAQRTAIGNGSCNAFVMGVSDVQSNYSYYHGANQSAPPKLVVTFH